MKKSLFILTLFIFIGTSGYSQSKKELKKQVETLNQQVVNLESQTEKSKQQSSNCQRKSDSINYANTELNRQIAELRKENEALKQKVKDAIKANEAKTSIPTVEKKSEEINTPKSSVSSSGSSSGATGDGRVIHTGPRGGKYYINSNGKKVYVKH
jgi:colicin import membrane protein